MTRRRFAAVSVRRHNAGTALLLLTACCALPAFAATPAATIDETAAAMELNDSAPARFLAPRAEAAIRNAFEDDGDEIALLRRRTGLTDAAAAPTLIPVVENDADSDADDAADEDRETDQGMTTRLPGISSEDMVRYKKVMFRRDI